MIAFAPFVAGAQQTADYISTNKGPVSIYPIQHATLVLTWNNKTIYIDPTGGASKFVTFGKPDIILLTDIHGDHFDLNTLDSIYSAGTTIIAPSAVAEKLPASLKAKLVVLANFDKGKVDKIKVSAIPMYNLPESPTAMHTKGRGNGYILKLGNKNIYISGDTEDIPEMRSLKDIDAAFICMNLPYTMDVDQAAVGVLAFKPAIVYPYHYRGQNGLSDVQKFKQLVNTGNPNIDVRLLKWY